MSQISLMDEPVIEHLCINALQKFELKSWYQKMFGFSSIFINGEESTFIRSKNGFIIEFVDAEVPENSLDKNVTGFRHLAFSVDSIDDIEEKLKAMNLAITGKSESDATKMLFFRDPEGNLIQIVARRQAL